MRFLNGWFRSALFDACSGNGQGSGVRKRPAQVRACEGNADGVFSLIRHGWALLCSGAIASLLILAHPESVLPRVGSSRPRNRTPRRRAFARSGPLWQTCGTGHPLPESQLQLPEQFSLFLGSAAAAARRRELRAPRTQQPPHRSRREMESPAREGLGVTCCPQARWAKAAYHLQLVADFWMCLGAGRRRVAWRLRAALL